MSNPALSGIAAIGTYATANINATHSNAVAAKADIAVLIALIPNNDAAGSSGAVAGGGFLDEMSPGAAAQLRVELNALLAAF